jgi:hypothetical protein
LKETSSHEHAQLVNVADQATSWQIIMQGTPVDIAVSHVISKNKQF